MTAKMTLTELVGSIINVPAQQLGPDSGPGTHPSWDSLAHVTIVAAAEDQFGVRLTMSEILEIKTIKDLHEKLQARGASSIALK